MTKEHRTTEGEMGDNFVLRIKEQKTRLTLHEHDDDDESMRIAFVLVVHD